MIKNKNVSQEKLKQYHSIDHHEIVHYPPHIREEICSSIFHNSNRKDMYVTKETVHEHFKNSNKTSGIGRGRFFKKKLEMICIKTHGNLVFFSFCIIKEKRIEKSLTMLMVLFF